VNIFVEISAFYLFFVILVSVTAAKVVEVSRRDSSILCRLSILIKCTLRGTDINFYARQHVVLSAY